MKASAIKLNEWKSHLTIALLASAPALAVAAGPEIANPVLLQARGLTSMRAEATTALKAKAAAPSAVSGDVTYDLTVKYTQSQLWNPTENRFDAVKLRSYVGNSVNPELPYVAPLVEVYPGQTVRMTLHNDKIRETGYQKWELRVDENGNVTRSDIDW